ncbi:hypothetical protein D4R52_01800 [bacterium]|nr:MAG: hypothetical protein D4R52_01800 [bacterium]
MYRSRGYYNESKLWKPPGLIQNKIAKNILNILGLSAVAVMFLSSPFGLYFLVRGTVRAAFRRPAFNREIKRLEKRGYVALTKTKDGFLVKLLSKGRGRLKKEEFINLHLPQEKIWDKKWRLFIFDIPEKERILRNLLRRKLKNLGMYNIQRSVFAYPFDCRKELNIISDHYNVSECATYAEVSYSDIDKDLRKYFKIN